MYRMIQSVAEGKLVYGIEGDGERVENISCDREALEKLIDLCNQGELSPCQLWEVAEDFVQNEAMV